MFRFAIDYKPILYVFNRKFRDIQQTTKRHKLCNFAFGFYKLMEYYNDVHAFDVVLKAFELTQPLTKLNSYRV